jgi:hypothetical protein
VLGGICRLLTRLPVAGLLYVQLPSTPAAAESGATLHENAMGSTVFGTINVSLDNV